MLYVNGKCARVFRNGEEINFVSYFGIMQELLSANDELLIGADGAKLVVVAEG